MRKGVFLMSDMKHGRDKGLCRTYGRGAGERRFERIPMRAFRPKISRLYDVAHAKYPQSGAYASDGPEGGGGA